MSRHASRATRLQTEGVLVHCPGKDKLVLGNTGAAVADLHGICSSQPRDKTVAAAFRVLCFNSHQSCNAARCEALLLFYNGQTELYCATSCRPAFFWWLSREGSARDTRDDSSRMLRNKAAGSGTVGYIPQTKFADERTQMSAVVI